MTFNSMHLQERQVVNIADGKCLGNIKDIELNLWTGNIESFILPALHGFWNRLQHSGELVITWDKVERIGVDVILVNAPELSEERTLLGKGCRRKAEQYETWKKEVEEYQEAMEQSNIIVLNQEDYREL